MKKFLVFISFAFLSFATVAQPAATTFEVDGIKVIFKPTVKEIINVSMYFRGGVTNYPANKAGIENLALVAATECGTKKYPKNTFKNIQDEYGIAVGGSSDYDYGYIRLNCISKYFDQGWGLFEEAINNPTFDSRELELIKTKLISGIRQRESDPDSHIEDLAMQSAFKNTPYAQDPDGTEQNLAAFSQSEVAAYYKQLLNKNRMFLVVVGKISKEELRQKIHASFAALPAKMYERVAPAAPDFTKNSLVTESKGLSTNYISGVVSAPTMRSPDYVPYRLAISLLGGGLFRELRTRLNLSYNPGAAVTLLRVPYATFFVSTNDPKASVEAIVDQIRILKSGTIQNENLNFLKGSYITNNYMKLESSADIASGLGEAEIMGDWRMAETLPERIEKATPQDILDAAQKYITGIKWAYMGDLSKVESTMPAFNEAVY